MTNNMMKLYALVEKTPDADLVREMIGFAAEKLMGLEVGAATGAGWGEKSQLRDTIKPRARAPASLAARRRRFDACRRGPLALYALQQYLA